MSNRLALYRTYGVCEPCLTRIAAADSLAVQAAAPIRAAARSKAASTRLTKRLARIVRRDRAARTRAINKAVRLATLPQDRGPHGG